MQVTLHTHLESLPSKPGCLLELNISSVGTTVSPDAVLLTRPRDCSMWKH